MLKNNQYRGEPFGALVAPKLRISVGFLCGCGEGAVTIFFFFPCFSFGLDCLGGNSRRVVVRLSVGVGDTKDVGAVGSKGWLLPLHNHWIKSQRTVVSHRSFPTSFCPNRALLI